MPDDESIRLAFQFEGNKVLREFVTIVELQKWNIGDVSAKCLNVISERCGDRF